MSDVNITQYMSLPLPIVGADPGPDWANNNNSSFLIIDQHNHSPGSGQQVNPSGININADLPINGNNLTLVETVNFQTQGSPISAVAPNLGCIYVSGSELYYNDEAGNQVQLTASGSVNATTSGISSGTATASFVGGVLAVKASSTSGADILCQSIELTNSGNLTNILTLAAPTLSSSYQLNLPIIPGVQSIMTLDSSGNMAAPYTIDNSTIQISSNIIGVKPGGITPTQIVSGYGLVPSGVIDAFGGASAPSGYLLCDGTSYLQATYPTLFAAIGTAYGSIDGTHFNVPDLRGQFLRGVTGASPSDPDVSSRTAQYAGGNIGNNVGSSQGYQIQSHTHTTNFGSNYTSPPNNAAISSNFGGAVTWNNATGGNETRPINVYVNYIIKI